MAIQKLNIPNKTDNAAKKQMVQSNTIGANETLMANEVNALVAKTNELVDATNNFTAITGFNFKENKATYAELASIVDPQKDDAYGVLADGLIYIYNGTSWPTEGNGLDLKLRPTGTVAEGVQEAVSGDQVSKATLIKSETLVGINAYDKNTDIEGFYLQASTGLLQSLEDCSISKIYPTKEGQIVYLKNRTGSSGFRYVDINGNPLKPLNIDGTQFPNYSSEMNGSIKAPSGAVGFQFTTKFTGTTNKDNIVLLYDVDSEVVKFKKELIPTTDFEIETRNLANSANSKIDPILGDTVPNRLNSGENTTTPEIFPPVQETSSSFGITISSDTESPVKDIIKYKRTFLNTLKPNGSNNRAAKIKLGAERPSRITIGFWTKKSQVEAIWTGSFNTLLGLHSYVVGTFKTIFNGDVKVVDMSGTPPDEYTSASLSVREVERQGDWTRIELSFYNIVWNEGFSGTEINFYWQFNLAQSNGNPLDITDFTILFNEVISEDIFYGDPDGEYLSNVITLKSLEQQITDVKSSIDSLSTTYKLRILKSNTDLYISNPYSLTQDFVRRLAINRQSTFSNNPNVNFTEEYLINKNDSLASKLTSIKGSGDDICPANLNGSAIGGNHSWVQGRNVVASNHGKTLADVGSVYKNSADEEFVILRIVDENNIWMISKNQRDDFRYSFIQPSGTLTYVSNGTNTGNIVISSESGLGNTYTTVSESTFKILLDNEIEVTETKEYSANNVKIIEEYYGLDLPSIIDDIIANRPTNGYTIQPQLNSFNSVKLIKHSIVYEVQENGCMLITTNFRTYNKKVNFNYHSFIQAQALASGNIYVPKSLPYVSGAKTYNLNIIEDWTTAPTTAINLTPEYWENPLSPPDRVVNMNTNTVFHSGYVTDRGVGFNRKDKVDSSMFLNNTTRKLYPRGDSIARVMDENTSLNCVAFRDFQNPANNPIGRTSVTQFEIGNEYFVYLDYHNSLIDLIDIPKKYIGCEIEVYEKVGDVELITDVVNGKIEVQSNVTTGNYGFLILKIK